MSMLMTEADIEKCIEVSMKINTILQESFFKWDGGDEMTLKQLGMATMNSIVVLQRLSATLTQANAEILRRALGNEKAAYGIEIMKLYAESVFKEQHVEVPLAKPIKEH